jgi:hypothetical protein
LHIGGHNPQTEKFEGIHWHVSKDVEVRYLATDDKRTEIAKIRVKMPDGTETEYAKEGVDVPKEKEGEWRLMDCIDCHNRPTHVYDRPEERVDFGLLSKKINPDIEGIREDSLVVIKKEYSSREDAREKMAGDLLALQQKRNPDQAKKNEKDIEKAAAFLLEAYLGNVWPDTKVAWGTYKSHLGHQDADEGYGCWRCHDEEHVNKDGETISQDCSLCHDEP